MKLYATTLVSLPLCFLAACASSMTRGSTTPDDSHAGVALDLQVGDAASPSFPARLTPASTSRAANRLAPRVVAELGGQAKADLKLCVDGAGAVTTAAIDRSSGIAELDDAFASDARTWKYAPLASPGATACQHVAISYRVTP